jgi:hypothetical protein
MPKTKLFGRPYFFNLLKVADDVHNSQSLRTDKFSFFFLKYINPTILKFVLPLTPE